MKKYVGAGILTGLLILMIGVCGCTMNKSDLQSSTESEVSLTQRQKDILTEMGLSAEYDDLTYSQKEAITAIEEMLTYADEKYGMTFCYAGYVAYSPGVNEEYMYAYPEGGDEERDVFKITAADNGYKDNYIETASQDLYAEYVLSGVQQLLPGVTIKVFADITSTTLTAIPETGTEFDGTTGAEVQIYVDGASCSEELFESFISDCEAYLYEHELYSFAYLTLLKEDNIKYITKYNYTDYSSKEFYYTRTTLYVQEYRQ